MKPVKRRHKIIARAARRRVSKRVHRGAVPEPTVISVSYNNAKQMWTASVGPISFQVNLDTGCAAYSTTSNGMSFSSTVSRATAIEGLLDLFHNFLLHPLVR